jgi:hypothetical protein
MDFAGHIRALSGAARGAAGENRRGDVEARHVMHSAPAIAWRRSIAIRREVFILRPKSGSIEQRPNVPDNGKAAFA